MIPIAMADLSGNEEKYVSEAVRSTWVSSQGAFLDRFETEFARMCGTSHCLGTANGTVALHLALLTLGVKPGDEVLVPTLTYIATANAVRYMGAVPVFVDVQPESWCLDPTLLERAITPRTVGIIPVHLYGHPADMDAINAVARKHDLWVVEDAAEAHLAQYKGREVGALSDIATFSFFGNKTFTCGEGGAITFNNSEFQQAARSLRGQGVDERISRYAHSIVGYNYRMTNVAAALLSAQLERAPEILARRRHIFAKYNECLSGIDGIGLQPVARWAVPTPWLYCITVDERRFGMSRDKLADRLRANGVDTRPFFVCLHHQKPYLDIAEAQGVTAPVAEGLSKSGLNLPTFNALGDDQIEHIADLVRGGG